MGTFFRRIGEGILYIIFLPVLLAILAIFAVYGVFLILTQGIKALVRFFKGESLYDPFEEDEKAYQIMKTANEAALAAQQAQAQPPSNTVGTINIYTNGAVPPLSDIAGALNNAASAQQIPNQPIPGQIANQQSTQNQNNVIDATSTTAPVKEVKK